MKNNIKLSNLTIVTINYDNLSDLVRTIESVDSQELKPYKHIIVSKKIKYKQITKLKKKNRIFLLNKDKSLYNAMNIGLKHTLNSNVLFLNSGDYFYNRNCINLISKYKNYLNQNKVLIFKTVLKNKNDYFYPTNKYFKNKAYLPHSSFVFFYSKNLKNIKFNEKKRITADGDWMREIQRKSSGIVKINKSFVIQNLDGQSSTPTAWSITQRLHENYWEGLKEILKFIIKVILPSEKYFRFIYFFKYKVYFKNKN